MKSRFRRLLTALILGMTLFGGIATLASATVQAQQRRRVIIVRRPIHRPFWNPWRRADRLDRFRYSRYVFDEPEEAFNRGYKDGVKVGQGDAKNHRTYKPERSHYYDEAGFGNYGEVYRQGFARGYGDGWRTREVG
ncbi:MAG: hypothetical protein WAQ99_17270 [Pyrinomonadaceae bacterium]